MNTNSISRPFLTIAATLALTAMVTVSLAVSGQAAGAPAKGASRLVSMNSGGVPRTAMAGRPEATKAHAGDACCQTVTRSQSVRSARGAEALSAGGNPVRQVAAHGCGGCSTTLETAGHGKAKVDQINHSCSRQTLAANRCCQ